MVSYTWHDDDDDDDDDDENDENENDDDDDDDDDDDVIDRNHGDHVILTLYKILVIHVMMAFLSILQNIIKITNIQIYIYSNIQI